MKRWRRHIKNGVFIAASALLIVAIVQLEPKPSLPGQAADPAHSPQWQLHNSTIQSYQADGSRHYRVTSALMTYFDHNNTTLLQQPQLQLFEADTVSWLATAATGHADNSTRQLTLSQNAAITQPQRQLTIRSETISGNLEAGLLSSDKAVTIEAPGTRALATGMRARLDDTSIKLLDDVYVEITPR